LRQQAQCRAASGCGMGLTPAGSMLWLQEVDLKHRLRDYPSLERYREFVADFPGTRV
jgi:hypothetical protein